MFSSLNKKPRNNIKLKDVIWRIMLDMVAEIQKWHIFVESTRLNPSTKTSEIFNEVEYNRPYYLPTVRSGCFPNVDAWELLPNERRRLAKINESALDHME